MPPSDAGSVIASVYDGLFQKLKAENAELREYVELLENQVIVAMTENQPELLPNLQALFASPLIFDEPVPFLPADPEEQRRADAQASDGQQCMIYRGRQ